MSVDTHALDAVFGPGAGQSPEERAKESTRIFVRSLDQLVALDDAPRATGVQLTARQALQTYGFDKLLEAVSEGSALLTATADAAGLPLRTRRKQLGLEIRAVARRAGVTDEEVEACEASRRLPLRTYEKVGRALGLDERYVAVSRTPRGNERLTVRLRQMGDDVGSLLGQSAVSALAEAGWVAMTQERLANGLGLGLKMHGLRHSSYFGSPGVPAYVWGYRLATETRQALGIPPDEVILSMSNLVQDKFGIPVVQTELGESIAGATIDVDGHRAIVVNRSGNNSNPFVWRTTIAHELEHLLFDPPDRLEALRVDEYGELERSAALVSDPVEQRANAFAVELLAPQQAILARFNTEEQDLAAVMDHFGIGQTPARHQIRNASEGQINPRWISARPGSEEWHRFSAWEGSESFTIDHHPLGSGIRPSRAGRFSAIVVRAAEEHVISWDTAGGWLETSESDVREAANDLRALFPGVWTQQG